LWTRLEQFEPEGLSQLLVDRRVVRIALMRGTIHLVTARDCLALRTVVQRVLDRGLTTNKQYALDVTGPDLEALVGDGRALLEEQPRTPKELGRLLGERWPGRDPASLAHAMRSQLPLVQVPPRGVWNASGATRHTTVEAWLGARPDSSAAPDTMVLRYLAAFGPATVSDVQAWSGLTRLGEVVDRLRPALRTFRDEDDRELFDQPDAPRPDPDVPAPARFLPEYDNLLLSHADRTRVIAEAHQPLMMTRNGIVPGTVLVDGMVAATWRISRKNGTATLLVEPFHPLTKKATAAVAREGAELLRFAAADDAHEVRITPTP
jgi:hypothetical protein